MRIYPSKYIIVCGAQMFQIVWPFVRIVVINLFFFSSFLKSFQDESSDSLHFNKEVFLKAQHSHNLSLQIAYDFGLPVSII